MHFVAFDGRKHYKQVELWQELKNRQMVPSIYFPKYGLIVEGVACGFLIKTDTPIALLDFFFGNPKAKQAEKLKAFKLISQGLIKEAVRDGFSVIQTDTKVLSLKKVANGLGFVERESTLFHVELKKLRL